MRQWLLVILMVMSSILGASPIFAGTEWTSIAKADLRIISDDDIGRHAAEADAFTDLEVSELRFYEAGYDWYLLRFVNIEKPVGPLWAVPHDDENAAFESALAAVKLYGGVAIMVNSGPGSSRMQSGRGSCGGRPAILSQCDPNRNFSSLTPLFTAAFLDQIQPDQPIIALHTNSPGHGAGKGNITIIDADAAAKGKRRPRANGYFGKAGGPAVLRNDDSYAILPFATPKALPDMLVCRDSLVDAGIHVWYEYVGQSDGSLSNFIALYRSEIRYVNLESRRELDLSLSAQRHGLMIAEYLKSCASPK